MDRTKASWKSLRQRTLRHGNEERLGEPTTSRHDRVAIGIDIDLVLTVKRLVKTIIGIILWNGYGKYDLSKCLLDSSRKFFSYKQSAFFGKIKIFHVKSCVG